MVFPQTKDDTNNIMMGGMETVDGSVDGVEEIRRYRRSLPSSLTDNFQTVKKNNGMDHSSDLFQVESKSNKVSQNCPLQGKSNVLFFLQYR